MKPTFYLLKNTPEDLWAVPAKDVAARAQLRDRVEFSSRSAHLPVFRVLIAYVDQLHNFVQQVPSLAWELLEYAQEPLEIVYPERKFAISEDEDAPRICVRLVQQPQLLKFLQKEGPVWTVLASSSSNISSELPPFSTVDCRDKKYPYEKVKTIAIDTDGTFTFLR